MQTNEIVKLARLKLLESGSEIITDETILIYANLSYKDVIKRAFPNNSIESATLSFTAGVATPPADFGTMYADAVDNHGNFYPEVSIAEFLRREQGSEQAVTLEQGEVKVSPKTVTSLNVKYYPTYPTLTSSQNPTIDEYLHEPIVYGILSRAFEDLQDPELAQFNLLKYEKMLTERTGYLSNYEEDPMRGNALFNGIRIM